MELGRVVDYSFIGAPMYQVLTDIRPDPYFDSAKGTYYNQYFTDVSQFDPNEYQISLHSVP